MGPSSLPARPLGSSAAARVALFLTLFPATAERRPAPPLQCDGTWNKPARYWWSSKDRKMGLCFWGPANNDHELKKECKYQAVTRTDDTVKQPFILRDCRARLKKANLTFLTDKKSPTYAWHYSACPSPRPENCRNHYTLRVATQDGNTSEWYKVECRSEDGGSKFHGKKSKFLFRKGDTKCRRSPDNDASAMPGAVQFCLDLLHRKYGAELGKEPCSF